MGIWGSKIQIDVQLMPLCFVWKNNNKSRVIINLPNDPYWTGHTLGLEYVRITSFSDPPKHDCCLFTYSYNYIYIFHIPFTPRIQLSITMTHHVSPYLVSWNPWNFKHRFNSTDSTRRHRSEVARFNGRLQLTSIGVSQVSNSPQTFAYVICHVCIVYIIYTICIM